MNGQRLPGKKRSKCDRKLRIPKKLRRHSIQYKWDKEQKSIEFDKNNSEKENSQSSDSEDSEIQSSNRLTRILNSSIKEEETFDIVIPISKSMKDHVHQLKMILKKGRNKLSHKNNYMLLAKVKTERRDITNQIQQILTIQTT